MRLPVARLPRLLAAGALALLLAAAPARAQERDVPCSAGFAGSYPCSNVDLLAHMPLSTFSVTGSGAPQSANEVWGWTDPQTGKEYALVGLSNGLAFVDVTNPTAPVFVGKLPQPAGIASSYWRTFRVYNDHVFVGSDVFAITGGTDHGIQVFDLRHLRNATGPPVAFTADARYTGLSRTHTLVINEQSGYLYAAGASGSNAAGCSGGGLHIVDVRDPLQPAFAGCYDDRGYTHEAQCLTYDGPDADYAGRSLCFQYQGTSLSVAVVDVTDPAAPAFISETAYPPSGTNYSHQGWLTDDGRLLLVNDEEDMSASGTRTIVMDVEDLDDPTYVGSYYGPLHSIAHNLYIRGRYAYESNYTGGLHILDVSSGDPATFTEVGFFDTYPADNSQDYEGQWHNYPYFASGHIVVTDISGGLFVLRANDASTGVEVPPPTGFSLSAPVPNPSSGETRFTLAVERAQQVRAEAFDAFGRRVAVVLDGAVPAGATDLVFDASALPAGAYAVRVVGETFTTTARVSVVR